MTTFTASQHPTTEAIAPVVVPCSECGTHVLADQSDVRVEQVVRYLPHPIPSMPGREEQVEVRVTRCESCAVLLARARDLTAALDVRWRYRLGQSQAEQRVTATLLALAVLRQPMPPMRSDPDALGSDLHRLARHLAIPGQSLAWLRRALTSEAGPQPWAHVTPADLEALRAGLAAAFLERREAAAPSTKRIVCPSGGCALCGVGVILVSGPDFLQMGGDRASAATALTWTARHHVDPAALGGRRSPDRIYGHTCPTCSRAIERTGSIGPTAMETALVMALQANDAESLPTSIVRATVEIPGLVGWGALVADARRREQRDPEPNATPWGHLPADALDEIRASLDLVAR